MPAKIPNLKLTYFGVRSRGEPIRLMLHYAGIPFEDVRIKPDDWLSLKAATPFGQLPLLEIDGKVLAQSWAIYRYVARLADLEGKNSVEAAFINQAAETFRDYFDTITPYIRAKFGFAKGDADEMYKSVFLPAVQKFLPQLEALLSSSGFFSKHGPCWVDFVVAEVVDTHHNVHADLIETNSKLWEHSQRVYALPQLQEYVKNRPFSPA